MRTLVTGGAGYFGELLSTKLLERGYWIRIFDVNRPTLTYPGNEVMHSDIQDSDIILNACEEIDIVFQNVAQVHIAKDKRVLWSVNRDGTKNLSEACECRMAKQEI